MLAEELKAIIANGKVSIPNSIKNQFEGREITGMILKESNKRSQATEAQLI
ncbi:MAG: hypothetical protein VKJ02_06785 [Snowella sp.]|nr:hypothetical protein [Snowella sp.]